MCTYTHILLRTGCKGVILVKKKIEINRSKHGNEMSMGVAVFGNPTPNLEPYRILNIVSFI